MAMAMHVRVGRKYQMEIANNSHLTYCTNIHAGESWEEVFTQLKTHIPGIKASLSPNAPFGIGLRLAALASRELLDGHNLKKFQEWLLSQDLYVFTMNGFPYGSFHHSRVKDMVHHPDWTTKERLDYTLDLFNILSNLLPGGMDGGVSTSPLSYKPWHKEEEREAVLKQSTQHLVTVALELHRIKERSGKNLHLDIEPEPDGLLENTADTLDYFSRWLIPMGIPYLKKHLGVSDPAARQIILNHIQVCYDVCHFAVMYEKPAAVLRQLQQAGIRVGRIQISAALKATLSADPQQRKETAALFASLNEPVYLHQVVEKDAQYRFTHYRDLDEALENIDKPEAREWRTHFHVPVFLAQYETLFSTQNDIITALEILKKRKFTNHLEVETYTWDVLPEQLKTDIASSIRRELQWVKDKM